MNHRIAIQLNAGPSKERLDALVNRFAELDSNFPFEVLSSTRIAFYPQPALDSVTILHELYVQGYTNARLAIAPDSNFSGFEQFEFKTLEDAILGWELYYGAVV